MNTIKCMSCKFYRVKTIIDGICRVAGSITSNGIAEYPTVSAEHSCEQWVDSGQQYHIRLGWVKGIQKKGIKHNA